MNREQEKKEMVELIKVYEETIGKDEKNIFTLDKFLKDCGYMPWGKQYIDHFYSYFHSNDLFQDVNLIFAQRNGFELMGFNMEPYALDYLNNVLELRDEQNDIPIYVDNLFVEQIPSIKKIGYLNVAFIGHYDYLVKLINEKEDIKLVIHDNYIDYNTIFATPEPYYEDEPIPVVDEGVYEDAVVAIDYDRSAVNDNYRMYHDGIVREIFNNNEFLGNVDNDTIRDMMSKLNIL